ncbi:MAG: DnaJ domain-containing protein [Oscillospiraceae bacterium]|jgi:curved DNA-binding protein CbpA|nr:DnaJ domain-containing protein [Oscillospiraceae bacterium]
MKDPYEVLGISKNATTDEVKSAYRELAKKYHPDNYSDNPLSDLASEKMREINEAYDFIINKEKRSSNSYDQSQNSYHKNTVYSKFPNVREFISRGQIDQAEQMLSSFPESSRDAEWFFLRGVIMCRKGWLDEGFANVQTACRMDPSNPEYRSVFGQLQSQRSGNFGPYSSTDFSNQSRCGAMDACSFILCADCCCRICN